MPRIVLTRPAKSPWRTPCGIRAPPGTCLARPHPRTRLWGSKSGTFSALRGISGGSHFPVERRGKGNNVFQTSLIHTAFEWRVPMVSESPEPRWCSNGTRRSRPVGDIVPQPPRRPAQLRRGCWVPASRAVRSNGCQREIRRAHARPRAPARAGGAPSRPRHALARRERRCGARTDAREQPSPS